MTNDKQQFGLGMVVCVALSMAGCAPAVRPAVAVTSLPPKFEARTTAGPVAAALPGEAWWRDFADPQLTSLVEQALTRSTTIRLAQARIREARALRSQSRAATLPSGSVSASGTRQDGANLWGGALPLSLVGAFGALKLAGLPLDLPVLIGLLMLMGLCAKNSILLVEFAIESEREGLSMRDALFAACAERTRPIIMTSVAMIAGMLPTALGLGEGSESRQPMAIAVVSSTVLSLVLVPAFYELVEAIEKRITPYLARLVRSPDADAEPEARPA